MGTQGWTAFDAAADGTYAAVSVRSARSAARKPQVLRCAHSSDIAIGSHAIEELARKVGAAGFPSTLALARGDYQMLVMPEAPVLDSEMEASLRWSVAPMLEFPVSEAGLSWMRIPTAAFVPAQEKQVYAIVASRSVLEAQEAYFKNAKPALKAIDIRETALRNIAALLEKKGHGLGLLTFSPAGITSTFTYRGELYLDRFIAQPMEEIYSGDEERARKFFDRVHQQVHQSIELINRTHPFMAIERIVVGPSTAPLALGRHLAERLPLPVQHLDINSIFDITATPQLLTAENQARYLVALGAALRGARKIS
jgi:MSHA biogenesis protein MshI